MDVLYIFVFVLLSIYACTRWQATLTAASAGMLSTWPSPSLPKLTSSNSPIGVTITTEEGSWIASISVLTMTFSAPFANVIVKKFGPKYTLLFSALPTFVGWVLCVYANSVAMLIAARCVCGFGCGVPIVVIPIYIGEISSKDIRGRLGALYNIIKLSGSLFVLTVGPYVSYEVLTWCCGGVSIIFAATFVFMPESPYYCVKQEDELGARKHLSRLLGNNLNKELFDEQLQEIRYTVEQDMKNRGGYLDLISNQVYLLPLGILIVVKTTQQMCGLAAVESYFQTIISASTSSVTPQVSSMIGGFVQLPSAIVAMILVEKLGRRVLFISSGIACGIAVTAEGAFFYIQNIKQGDLSNVGWLPTTALILYLIMNSFGLSTIPYILMSEMFPTNMKSVALSVTVGYGGISAFLVAKFFMPISETWGMHTTFWIFAGFCFGGSFCTYLILPETKGKTFDEIQVKFRKRALNDKSLKCCLK